MATIIEEFTAFVKQIEDNANENLELVEKLRLSIESLRAVDKDEAAVATPKKAFVNATRLNVYEKPSRKSAKTGEFSEGVVVNVIDVVPEVGEHTGWVRVVDGTNVGGFLQKKSLDYNL